MAEWDEELGGILPSPTAVGSQHGSWTSWLQDPVNRAGLLSFGTQLMTGGGGTFGQELGAGLSKGFEGAAATEAVQVKRAEEEAEQAFKQQQLAQQASEGAAGRANQMAIARMNAAQRAELAAARQAGTMEALGLRGQQALERAQLRAAGSGASKGLNWNQAMTQARKDWEAQNPRKVMKGLTPEDTEEIQGMAADYYHKSRSGEIGAGGAPKAAAPAAPGAAAPVAPKVPGAGTGMPQSTGVAPKSDVLSTLWSRADYESFKSYPKIREALKDPAARDHIKKNYPEYRALIEADPEYR